MVVPAGWILEVGLVRAKYCAGSVGASAERVRESFMLDGASTIRGSTSCQSRHDVGLLRCAARWLWPHIA